MGNVPVSITIETRPTRRERAYQAMNRAFDEARRIEKRVSEWGPESETSLLNKNSGQRWVPVGRDLMEILLLAKKASEVTEGAFDITFASRGRATWEDVLLLPDLSLAALRTRNIKIGVSGIAKGYIVDRMSDVLRKQGFRKFLINAGDIYASGRWKVAIHDPDGPPDRAPCQVTLNNQAISTSGLYERGPHIIDPRTKKPVLSTRSISVIARTSAWADALATGLFVLRRAPFDKLRARQDTVLGKEQISPFDESVLIEVSLRHAMRNPKEATTLCSLCPKLCRYSCPVADADQNEATTPWGKMSTMKMVEEKKIPMTAETMALAWKCLNCRLSEEVCELDNPVAPTLDHYRIKAFQAGLAPPAVTAYCKKFQDFNNPFGLDLLKELQKNFPERLRSRKKTAYFPGCTEIAKDLPRLEIGKTLKLLERCFVKSGSVGLYHSPIQCCGYPLYVAGDWEGFVELARINSRSLREYDLLISGAPACLYTMETFYRQAGHPVSTRFVHVAEMSCRGGSLWPPSVKGPPVAYHDPCYLGRYRNTYDAPRELIRRVSGRPPGEFSRNRELSYCCGAGGLLPVSNPETAERITKNRIEEFRATGAKLLVTGCPTCAQRFRKFGIEAKSLNDYLADAC